MANENHTLHYPGGRAIHRVRLRYRTWRCWRIVGGVQMMKFIRTRLCNLSLGKPRNWDDARDGICAVLPVCRDEEANVFYSWWHPTPQECFALLAGHPIRLTITGQSHPPVALEVDESIKVPT